MGCMIWSEEGRWGSSVPPTAECETGDYDTLIAAHARSLQATLITHNTREFGRVDGLRVEDWASAVGNA